MPSLILAWRDAAVSTSPPSKRRSTREAPWTVRAAAIIAKKVEETRIILRAVRQRSRCWGPVYRDAFRPELHQQQDLLLY